MKDHPTDAAAILIEEPSIYIGPWLPIRDVEVLAIQAAFNYGAGGGSVVEWLQTTFDEGKTAIDIAAFEFGKKSETKFATISANDPAPSDFVPQDQGLAPGTIVNSVLGNRVRTVIKSTGAPYANNTSIKIHVAPR